MNHGIQTRKGSDLGIASKDRSVELVSEKSPEV